MKKTLWLIAIIAVAFSLSACTLKSPGGEEKRAPLSASQDEDNNLADDQSAAAPVTPTDKTNPSAAVQDQKIMPSPDQQVDLLKEYSKAEIKTNFGTIIVKLYDSAPLAANNFLNLAQAGFFDNTKFHRVIKDFMIQGGDPNSRSDDTTSYGLGGPGYKFKNEDSGHKLVSGSLAMANAGPDTNGSQFFIVTAAATPWLDGGYTNFGEVESGLDVVKKIESTAVKASPSGEDSLPASPVVISSIKPIK